MGVWIKAIGELKLNDSIALHTINFPLWIFPTCSNTFIIMLSIYWSCSWQVEEKYRVYKERLEQALALVEGKTAVCSSPVEEKPPSEESNETSC